MLGMSSFGADRKHQPTDGPNQPVVDPEHRPTREACEARFLALIDKADAAVKNGSRYPGFVVKRLLEKLKKRVRSSDYDLD